MTKEQVIQKIGNPDSDMTEGNVELLGWTLERPLFQLGRFTVKIVDGKVQSYDVTDH
jgi:hypothetical protein